MPPLGHGEPCINCSKTITPVSVRKTEIPPPSADGLAPREGTPSKTLHTVSCKVCSKVQISHSVPLLATTSKVAAQSSSHKQVDKTPCGKFGGKAVILPSEPSGVCGRGGLVCGAPQQKLAKESMPCAVDANASGARGPCGICKIGGQGETCKFCVPKSTEDGLCLICIKGPSDGFSKVRTPEVSSGVCGRGAQPSQSAIPKGTCGVKSSQSAIFKSPCKPPAESKAPYGVCKSEHFAKPQVKPPCPICGNTSDQKGPFSISGTVGQIQSAKPSAVCGTKPSATCATSKVKLPEAFEDGPCGICKKEGQPESKPQLEPSFGEGPCGVCGKGKPEIKRQLPSLSEDGPCGICKRGQLESKPQLPPPSEDAPCGICKKEGQPESKPQLPTTCVLKPCEICNKVQPESKPQLPPPSEDGPCGICKKGHPESKPQLPSLSEDGPCGICKKGHPESKPQLPSLCEDGPCGICKKGHPESKPQLPPPSEDGPCGICKKGQPEGKPQLPPPFEDAPCGICKKGQPESKPQLPPPSEDGPCGICKKGHPESKPQLPPPFENAPCQICKEERQPERCSICIICGGIKPQSKPICEPVANEGQKPTCAICKKTPISSNTCPICSKKYEQASGTFKRQEPSKATCNVCQKVEKPLAKGTCGICSKGGSASTSVKGPCGVCSKSIPISPKPLCRKCGKEEPRRPPCSVCKKPGPPRTPCAICEDEPGKPKYYMALPQHKEIQICSPCRYTPSPLIDEDGHVFCPFNCGCCLCPWRRRATDSQEDQLKHQKIKVCKCRDKGTLFKDFSNDANKCSNTSYFDVCPCREKAEAKYLEMFGVEMWDKNDRLNERVRGMRVLLDDVVEITP